MLNDRFHVKAWVENVSGSGHVLNLLLMFLLQRPNAQNQMVSDDQTTTFNPTSKAFDFMLDSPAYKGGL